MEHHGTSWNIMEHHGTSWNIIEHQGLKKKKYLYCQKCSKSQKLGVDLQLTTINLRAPVGANKIFMCWSVFWCHKRKEVLFVKLQKTLIQLKKMTCRQHFQIFETTQCKPYLKGWVILLRKMRESESSTYGSLFLECFSQSALYIPYPTQTSQLVCEIHRQEWQPC